MVTNMYALNVLTRYGANPGPRHIQFAKHLLRYAKYTKYRLKFNTHNGPTDIETKTGRALTPVKVLTTSPLCPSTPCPPRAVQRS